MIPVELILFDGFNLLAEETAWTSAIPVWLILLDVNNLLAVLTFSADTRTIVLRILVSLWAEETTCADAIPELSKFKNCTPPPVDV